MKPINEELLDLGRAQYRSVVGLDDMPRDKDGFILLKPTAAHVDKKMTSLTADIGSLEEKLRKYRAEKEKTEKYTKTDDYKESKKQMSKKKQKKKRDSLLAMVFNNADNAEEEDEEEYDEEEGSGYIEKKSKKKGESSKKNATTLETTYGKRFSPVVAMLHDTIMEFDQIAAEIEEDLKNNKNSSRTMYRSSQIGNMISAKNSKLSAVKELASVAKTLSDLEYKQAKDKKDSEAGDQNKAVASMAAKILRGGLDDLDDSDSGKKGKKGKKDKDGKKKKVNFGATVRGLSAKDEDDDDEEYGSIKRSKSDSDDDQRALANEFAKTLQNRKGDIKLTAWEKNINMEGKYQVMVIVDPTDLEDYRFIAVDKNGKEIKGFKDDYPDLLPKKKKCRMRFDLSKNRVSDLNSARTYKLIYKN